MVAAGFSRILKGRPIALVLLATTVCGMADAAVHGPRTPFTACLDYHCDRQQRVVLSDRDWQDLGALFPPGLDAPAERAAIRRAIALFEQRVGAVTGTWRDLGENAAGAGLPGQLDCIAESRNTTTYLRLLADAGLLHWHQVLQRVRRQRWIFAIHWTAVIRDTSTGATYAVDSWPLDNGQPPYIQPLDAWRHGVDFDAG